MDSSPIEFFSEDCVFSLPLQNLVSVWMQDTAKQYGCMLENISIIFCSDAYLLALNQEHLQHDFYTDILTFPIHEPGSKWLKGDIFISIDRVKENAQTLDVSFSDELHRVIIHGVFHLIGFDDQKEEEEAQMRLLEDGALQLRGF